MQELYQLILPVHGVILEFGVRWGQNLALFSTLRGVRPFNYSRRVIGSIPGQPAWATRTDPVAAGDTAFRPTRRLPFELLAIHEADSPIAKRKFGSSRATRR
jgi:hypothetical protein